MELILFVQKLSSAFLSVMFSAFEILSGLEFFVFLFAFLFLVIDKNIGYKYFLSGSFGFLFGSIFMKNVVARKRPYEINSEIITEKSRYSFSFPSAGCVMAGVNSFWTVKTYSNAVKKNQTGKISYRFFVLGVILYCILVCFAKIYFADNFLLDVLAGVMIGVVVSYVVFKFVKETKISKNICGIILSFICLGLLIFFGRDIFDNNFKNIAVFEFCGVCLAILLGMFIEEKFIKFEIKNNMLSIVLKLSVIITVVLLYFYVMSFLPGIVALVFLKYFLLGIITTVILPICFKKLQRLCYVFSDKIDVNRVVKSFVVMNEKRTKKVCKQIARFVENGDCVLVEGEMGAGKSFVIRCLLEMYGVKDSVLSPTYTLFNDYKVGVRHFYHFDLYRLENEEEALNIGFEEIVDDKNAIKFIEWAENAKNLLPKEYKKITIVKLGKKARNIIFEDYNN